MAHTDIPNTDMPEDGYELLSSVGAGTDLEGVVFDGWANSTDRGYIPCYFCDGPPWNWDHKITYENGVPHGTPDAHYYVPVTGW